MPRLNDIQKIEAVQKYNTGKYTCNSLGREYGIRGDSMRDLLLRRGVKLKSRSQATRKYVLDENYFDNIDSQEKAYFLGLLYADGYNNTSRGEIHLSLQEEDKYILDKFREVTNSNRPLLYIDYNYLKYGGKIIYRYDVSSRHMSQRLHELGCFKAKSLSVKFPTPEQVPDYLISHFIRGYFDGDGCITSSLVKETYNQYSLSIVSTEDFCLSLQKICNNLKINSFITKRHKDRIDTNRNFQIGGNIQVQTFLDWLYENSKVYLNRKFLKYEALKKYNNRKNKNSIEPMFPTKA